MTRDRAWFVLEFVTFILMGLVIVVALSLVDVR